MMPYFLLLLVMSVFLGTEILAIDTPIAQITLYRIIVMGMIFLSAVQLFKRDDRLKIKMENPATIVVIIYFIWLIWAIISGLWVMSYLDWFQAVFLLTLGVASVVLINLWIGDIHDWHRLLSGMWLMMTILVVWGLFEITTNFYLLADLTKLDPQGIFSSQASARIPITIFANQNDYATMLIAYLSISVIKFVRARHYIFQFLYLACILMALFLIYRSESRMILLSVILFFFLYILLEFNWQESGKQLIGWGIVLMIVMAIFLIPALRNKISQLFYFAGDPFNTGDSRRVNLWRNGFIFLGQTFGFGVGAGNIEVWMEKFSFFETNQFTNIHNWWLEILVGYGAFIFILYTLAYGLLIHSLLVIRNRVSSQLRRQCNSFLAFLFVYIFASITSANNMLIEWHWVFFAILICFVKIVYNQTSFEGKRCFNECINNY